MHTNLKEMRIDRIEEGLAVGFTEDGEQFTLPKQNGELRENDIILAEVDESGEIISYTIKKEETETVKQTMQNRLRKLFNK